MACYPPRDGGAARLTVLNGKIATGVTESIKGALPHAAGNPAGPKPAEGVTPVPARIEWNMGVSPLA